MFYLNTFLKQLKEYPLLGAIILVCAYGVYVSSHPALWEKSFLRQAIGQEVEQDKPEGASVLILLDGAIDQQRIRSFSDQFDELTEVKLHSQKDVKEKLQEISQGMSLSQLENLFSETPVIFEGQLGGQDFESAALFEQQTKDYFGRWLIDMQTLDLQTEKIKTNPSGTQISASHFWPRWVNKRVLVLGAFSFVWLVSVAFFARRSRATLGLLEAFQRRQFIGVKTSLAGLGSLTLLALGASCLWHGIWGDSHQFLMAFLFLFPTVFFGFIKTGQVPS